MSRQNITILAIAPYRFLPAVNGGHKAIEQLYRNLGKLAKTMVVSVKSNDESLADGYRLMKLFSNSFLHYINVFYFFRLKRLIREHQVTHVITEHPYMGWLGILLRKYTGARFVVRAHNIEAVRFKTIGKGWWKAMWWYEKWIYGQADLVCFITEEDREYAVKEYKLEDTNCTVLKYGIDQQQAPSANVKAAAKKEIAFLHQIPFDHHILLFNGDLGYQPNALAVKTILSDIEPLLSRQNTFQYTLIICGRNLPETYIKEIENSDGNIIYTGYVTDIATYFLAADVFINPVTIGGGIKTKLVEALSCNCNVVSTKSGAQGVNVSDTNNKLIVVKDDDWQAFANAIVHSDLSLNTPAVFYDHFYWGNIAGKAISILQNT